VIGTFHAQPQSTQVSHLNPKSIASNVQNALNPTLSTGKNSKVNSAQSTPAGKNKSKKGKGKNKEDKNNPQYEKSKMQSVMIRISANPDTLALSVVIITTGNIVQDMSRSLSSFKGPRSLPHLSFCPNLSLLNRNPNWSFTTNPLLPPLPMSLCVLVIQKIMTLHLLLEPKITLPQRIKLTIYHFRWFNRLPQLHLPTVLFISNDRAPIQFSSPLQSTLF
jgi:hypothetical protein